MLSPKDFKYCIFALYNNYDIKFVFMPAEYYQVLEISETATQQQIKQAYKKLALKYHPDKNTDKQSSTIKFREISEAYSVLNDPKKRQNYDKYGTADMDLDGMGFQDFMGDFGAFEDFLEEFLSFNDFEAMFKEMTRKQKKKAKGRGRGKGRGKGSRNDLLNMAKMGGKGGMPGMAQMFGSMGMGGDGMEQALLEALLQSGDIDINDLMDGFDQQAMQKQLQKMMFGEDEQEDDEQDLTEQELKILEFGEKNVTQKKVGGAKKKKKELRCNFDNQKVKKDQILMHFSEKHMNQFKQWQKQCESGNIKTEQKKEKFEQEQQIQY